MADGHSLPYRIKITNAAGGHGWTSRKQAKRYVLRGTAMWTTPARLGITFILRDPDHQTVQRRVLEGDRGMAGVRAIKNIPVTGDPMKLLVSRF